MYALIRNGKVVQTVIVGLPPENFIECPDNIDCGWIATKNPDGTYSYEAPPPAPDPADTVEYKIEQIKREAGRRIEAIMPDYAQRNHLALFAETAMQYGTDPSKWPQELRAVNNKAMGKWAEIKRLRKRSNTLEEKLARGESVDLHNDTSWVGE